MSLLYAGSMLRVLRRRGSRRGRFGTANACVRNPVPTTRVIGVNFIGAGAVLFINVDREANREGLGEGFGGGRRG